MSRQTFGSLVPQFDDPEKRESVAVSESMIPTGVVDAIDRKLLRHLQADARISMRGLARAIGMSAGAVGERLERLEARGVIRGYRVDVDAAALGLGLEALIGVELTQHQSVLETMEFLRQLPEVSNVELVTGRWDLVVRVRVRDQQHLKRVLTDDVWKIPNLSHSESMIVLDSVGDHDFLDEVLGDD